MKFLSPALITGASGFVGSHLAEALARQKVKVKLLVRPTSRLPFKPTSSMELCYGDVTDLQSLQEAVKGVKVVYHLAGLLRGADFSAYQKVNAEGTRNVCLAVEKEKGVKRLVYVSSLSAAGPSPKGQELDETMPSHPISFYGRTKRMGEKIALSCRGKFEVTILRPGAVYGPRETDIFEYFKMVGKGLVVNNGDGTQKVSFIYVDDLIDAILRAAHSPKAKGQIYFVSDGKSLDWNELSALIGKELKKPYKTFNVPLGIVRIVATLLGDWPKRLFGKSLLPPIVSSDKIKEGEAPGWVCDNRKIQKELGFKPQFDIRRGIKKAVEFYQKAGWLKS
jgi:nucleoside-diphosphate-sugar epimerase